MNLVDLFLSLPWTVLASQETYDEETFTELTVEELPGFLVAGESDEEAEEAFWPALRLFLESYIEDGELPPLPATLELVAFKEDRPEQHSIETLDIDRIIESLSGGSTRVPEMAHA
jgi:predicted RNase H-like HicB family nuclease